MDIGAYHGLHSCIYIAGVFSNKFRLRVRRMSCVLLFSPFVWWRAVSSKMNFNQLAQLTILLQNSLFSLALLSGCIFHSAQNKSGNGLRHTRIWEMLICCPDFIAMNIWTIFCCIQQGIYNFMTKMTKNCFLSSLQYCCQLGNKWVQNILTDFMDGTPADYLIGWHGVPSHAGTMHIWTGSSSCYIQRKEKKRKCSRPWCVTVWLLDGVSCSWQRKKRESSPRVLTLFILHEFETNSVAGCLRGNQVQ